MSNGYIKSLDGVRALAIILVMTFHYELNHFGWLGVQLFFVLSGFLITGILWNEKHRDTTLAAKFKKFWARRSLRIFPLYYGYLLFFLVTWLAANFPTYYPTYIPYLATYTFNFTRTLPEWTFNPLFTHLWSLCVEEQFYLFFPLIMFLTPARFIKALMVIFIFAAPLIRLALGAYYQSKGHSPEVVADTVYWNTLSHLDAFFIGGAIPVFGLNKKVKKAALLFWIFLTAAVGAGAVSYVVGANHSGYLANLGYAHGLIANYEHVWSYTLLNLFFASFILVVIGRRIPILESNWLVRIGKVSYGMYIFHWAILVYFYNKVLIMAGGGTLVKLLLFIPYLALVYGFAEISFRLYENRFIKLKDKFFSGKPTKVLATDIVSAP